MSLARMALRLAAVQALRGATLAGDRVFDSTIESIDRIASDGRAPLIIVTTDEHESEANGRDMIGGPQSCDLVIEVAVASKAEVAKGEFEMVIPHTDAAMEITIDLMERQVVTALTGGGPWSDVWMRFALEIKRKVSRRGATAEQGVRMAARQVTLTCELVADPVAGQALHPSGSWAAMLAAMDGVAELATFADLLRAEFAGDGTDWGIAAAALGIPASVVDAIGLTPPLDENGAPVDLTEVGIGGEGDWPSGTIDEGGYSA